LLCGLGSLRKYFFYSLKEGKTCLRNAGAKKASKVKPLRLGAMPAVDRLCVSTFFTHKGEKQTSQLKPLRLSAFARVLFLFS
jgi:hypothetical protein